MAADVLRVTALDRDYCEKLTAPRWYWFRRNWFPASVAAGTILFSLSERLPTLLTWLYRDSTLLFAGQGKLTDFSLH